MVARMASNDSAFQYRLHAFQMNAGMFGMVTQEQVQDLWKYLRAEALEFQGGQSKKDEKHQEVKAQAMQKGTGEGKDEPKEPEKATDKPGTGQGFLVFQ